MAPNERERDHGDGTPSHRGQAPRQTQNRPTATRHRITRHTTALPSKKQKTARANIKIATLNIRGRNATNTNGPNNKWRDLNQVLRDSRTGIIALQETHLTDDIVDDLHNLFGSRMKIIFSQGANPRAAGVAFVINKDIAIHRGIITHEIIPGRALLISVPWHANLMLTILNVYAPNTPLDNENFWNDLSQAFNTNPFPYPDILLGDFNMVEDAIDRLPSHNDNANTRKAHFEFRTQLELVDGWRTYNGNEKGYTHTQKPSMTRSCIDRIYTTNQIFNTATDWEINTSPIDSDHCLTSVKISDPAMPWQGHGRWKLPLFLLKDRDFKNETRSLALQLNHDTTAITARSHTDNPQILFKAFKDQVKALAITKAKTAIPKITKKLIQLKQEHKSIINDPTLTEPQRIAQAGPINDQIEQLERKKFQKAKNTTKTRFALEGETISQYWSLLNKENQPRDPIFSLRKPGSDPPSYETNTHKMAEIARSHHETLLTEGIHPDEAEREAAIEQVLEDIDEQSQLPILRSEELSTPINEDLVKLALQESACGTAPGINGIPYEFWKMLSTNQINNQKDGKSNQQQDETTGTDVPNRPTETEETKILETLTCVYKDIETHGVQDDSAFAEGWLCPLYKKKDKREIGNYRPITLLNTDYKIYTKALTIKLTTAAPYIIHPNQAGFMPGRSIHDQVRLAKLMVNYAEATEENGLIVALDQEKAYDKICHDYLWRTMKKYNLPQTFINTVRSLYESAETVVILNGAISHPFQVSRGVRQGDPLSCLLFNIAIEPLANLLRMSEDLKGFKIPGAETKLITNLFADDTTVYLNQEDDFQTLAGILHLWCRASGARFNESKTEIIPIGTQHYRDQLINTKQSSPDNTPLDPSIHIAKDREPTRILGGWIGNGIDEQAIWSKNLEKINSTFERWGKRHPTLIARRLVVQMFAGGISQYMTTVQGMPKDIESTMQKMINSFVWGGDRAQINLKQTRESFKKGGIKLLDIRARNEAIDIMWLKKYLDLGPSRPLWASIADILIEDSITKSNNTDRNVTINTYLQNWSPSINANSKLPPDLKRMIHTGKTYNVSFSALTIPEHIKSELPAWYHIGADINPRGFLNSRAPKCLKSNHLIRTTGDLVRFSNRIRTFNPHDFHQDLPNCPCAPCTQDRALGCPNPIKCCHTAREILTRVKPKWNPLNDNLNTDGLSLTPRRKKANEDARTQGSRQIFNPSIRNEGNLETYFRVFVDPTAVCHDPALRPMQLGNIIRHETKTYIESCNATIEDDPRTGSGIWYGRDHHRNTSLRSQPDGDQKHHGILVAALWALTEEPPFNELIIHTTSRFLVDGILKNLKSWEAIGFINIDYKDLFRALAARLRSRGAPTSFLLTSKNTDDPNPLSASDLAELGTIRENPDEPDLSIDPRFNLTGAQLSLVTQKLAYMGICNHKSAEWRRGTTQMLDITRHAIRRNYGTVHDDKTIWQTVRNKDFNKPYRTFLWKALHKNHKIGAYWSYIPNYEHRSLCHKCGTTEDLEHIVLECDIPGQGIAWNITKTLWLKKVPRWPELKNIGDILGCGLAEFKNGQNKPIKGANRLYRILISEITLFIWKLRNERLFKHDSEETWPNQAEIHSRWLAIINARLTLDRSATHSKYERKAIKTHIVLDTWGKTLKNEHGLPKNWIATPGVLVDVAISEHQEEPDLPEEPP